MYRFFPVIFLVALSLMPRVVFGAGFDPFSTQNTVSGSPSKSMITLDEAQDPCRFTPLGSPLGLLEVVERALCNNPQTREAWANVKQQAALVGVSKAAYLPTINGTLAAASENTTTTVVGFPSLGSNFNGMLRNDNISLNWVLFDFGLRKANLENALQLLTAANASQDATLQTVFLKAAQNYYDLLAAQAEFDASKEAENFARESYMAADAKYQIGVNVLADKLEAQTSYAQATLNRVKSNEVLKNAQGTLAIVMGLSANTLFMLEADKTPMPDISFVKSVDELIEEAKRTHPDLRAAQAQLSAAQAKVEAIKATGLPTVSLNGGVASQDQLTQIPTDAVARNNSSSIGIQLTIPLFDGFLVSYQTQSAQAQVESQAVNLANVEQQISLDVWKSYQALSTETEDLIATKYLLQSANQSFEVTLGRYKAGLGNILELLTAQSTLASAQRQRIQAFFNWRIARLKLAQSLGRLGLWAIQ